MLNARTLLSLSENLIGYHVTKACNLDYILKDGLKPQLGHNSLAINEPRPAVYLFRTMEDVEDAIMNWLEVDEDEDLFVLEVLIPPDAAILPTSANYEIVIGSLIPPNFIRNVNKIA